MGIRRGRGEPSRGEKPKLIHSWILSVQVQTMQRARQLRKVSRAGAEDNATCVLNFSFVIVWIFSVRRHQCKNRAIPLV